MSAVATNAPDTEMKVEQAATVAPESNATAEVPGGPSEETVPPTKHQPTNMFDYSDRKVLIHGVPKYYEERKARALVDSWVKELSTTTECSYEKVRKAPNSTLIRITLMDPAMVKPLIEHVNTSNVKIKSKSLCAKPDQGRKRQSSDNKGLPSTEAKRSKKENTDATEPISIDQIKDKLIPLWRSTPEEQKDIKMRTSIRKCAMKIVSELRQKFR